MAFGHLGAFGAQVYFRRTDGRRKNVHCIFLKDGWTEDGRTEDERPPYIFGGQTDGGRMDTVYFRRTEEEDNGF